MDLSGRIPGFGSSLGSTLDASGTSLVLFVDFLAAHRVIFSKSLGILTYECIIENIFLFIFSVLVFEMAVCEETWSTEHPGGSIFML